MSKLPDDVRGRVVAVSGAVPSLAGYSPFSVARLTSARGSYGPVLVKGVHALDEEVQVAPGAYLTLPATLSSAAGLAVAPLAAALAIWRRVGLELGDAAVWTDASDLSALIGQAAIWSGALPAVVVGKEAPRGAFNEVEFVSAADPEQAARRLADLIGSRPGFAGVDLTGQPELIDLFFEVMPKWGRLVLAGAPGAPLTIDFYKNLHRKGAVVVTTTLDPVQVFEPDTVERRQLAGACRILSNPQMCARCLALLGTPDVVASHAFSG